MYGPVWMVLVVVVPAASALLVAFALHRRGHAWLGLAAGVGVILAVQVLLQWRLQAEVNACVARACAPFDDEMACAAASFGCHEWTGLAALAYLVAAGLDLILLAAALAAAYLLARRRRTGTNSG